MDQTAQRDLKILNEVAERANVTQRGLAKNLDIALGLTNLYLKRLVRKGFIKIRTIPPNRIKYLLTPKGFAEKSRLTYEYVEYSLRLYRQTRAALRGALEPLARRGARRVVLCGTAEAAELAYLTMRELGLELTGVVAESGGASSFFGLPVRPLASLRLEELDVVIVATFAPPDDIIRSLTGLGIPRENIVPLRGA
ncbi:MAG: winged helix-turn-helix transcriptional regulator [Candidatus Rokubacteria bacterium]|nr:winged helix-turn-helix transcriptional regulator [Candidatus Rokubacteria bacterium]